MLRFKMFVENLCGGNKQLKGLRLISTYHNPMNDNQDASILQILLVSSLTQVVFKFYNSRRINTDATGCTANTVDSATGGPLTYNPLITTGIRTPK